MSVPSSPTRTRPADADDIRYAYRLLLGREPDPGGFETYSRLVNSSELTPEDLAGLFIGSNEFAARHDRALLPVEVLLDGYSMFVRPIDRDIGRQILESKSYEPHVSAVVRSALKPGDTFVDVGANIGFFTALAAHLVGAAGKVVAIEPMDKNVQLLYAIVWRNRFRHVEIQPYAASEANGLVPMATSGSSSNGQVVPDDTGTELPTLFAQAKRLDDLLADVAGINLLKIDIEGHELRALRGYAEGLARHRPRLITEFHPKCMRENAGVDPHEYLAFLFAYGARIEVLHHDGKRVVCSDADAVLGEWQRADRRYESSGATHLDLFVTPRS